MKKTFKHFPREATCPICDRSDDKECVLIPIDGTTRDRICEGQPVHMACMTKVGWRMNRNFRLIYTKY